MYIGPSIALIAIGAILRFAVEFSVSGIEIQTVGTILIIVGVLGVALSLVLMLSGDRRRDVRGDPYDAPTRRDHRY